MESEPGGPSAETSRQELVEARALLSSLNEFSLRAGHDMLGPLSQSGSLLALFIKRHRGEAGDDGEQLLDFLLTAAGRMEAVVNGVRRFMEFAARRPRMERVDLNAALAASLASFHKSITASGATIVAQPLPIVIADAAHMVTMFEILIGNATKFRKPESAPHIQISARREGALAVITIEDNGIGIEPENLETAFVPFKRLNGREYAGAGLGLATARLIASMHGCRITLEAAHSGGTRAEFTVLPA